jgi:hypothetical protein
MDDIPTQGEVRLIEWCNDNAPLKPILPYELFLAAKSLATYQELAAQFCVDIDELIPYESIIDKAKDVAQFEMKQLIYTKAVNGCKESLRLYFELTKLEISRKDNTKPLSRKGVKVDKHNNSTIRGLFGQV